MPKLDLINAKQIKTGAGEILQLKGPGFSWAKPVAIPVISIQSGSGYAGSVYSATISGAWTANGIAIPNQTGNTFTMTPEYEGRTIQCNGSNSIKMWTPYDIPVSARGFWFDMRRANLIDNRIDSVADNWGSTLTGNAPSANDRPNTGLVNGQLTSYRVEARYPDSRRLLVNPIATVIETVVAYKTPDSYGSTAYPWNDHVLIGALPPSNDWRRIRSVNNSANFVTEGQGTVVFEDLNTAGITPLVKACFWRSSDIAKNGYTLWARGTPGASDGGMPGNHCQVLGLTRNSTTDEKRLISAYIAWIYGSQAGLSVNNPYRNSPPINV